jgi:hypothetical protein
MVKITNNKGIFTKKQKQTQNQNQKQNNKKRTFRKMNCSPMVKGKTVVSDSCFPP